MFSSFAAALKCLSTQGQSMTFLETVEEILEVGKISSYNKDTKLIEIGIESVKLVEVAALIEQTFDVPVNEDAMLALTVQDILDYAQKQ